MGTGMVRLQITLALVLILGMNVHSPHGGGRPETTAGRIRKARAHRNGLPRTKRGPGGVARSAGDPQEGRETGPARSSGEPGA